MSAVHLDKLVDDYKRKNSEFDKFANEMKELITRLLSGEGIRTAQIECRTKTVDSLAEKLGKRGKAYSELASIPDLAGIRVILYDLSDVHRAVAVIEREFDVDLESSGDAAARLSPHEFGYRSVHLVIRLLPKRRALSEWHQLAELHAEIQVRTVLQHAWASISHSLQYKREEDVPDALRRRLNRLSALLELADQEFATLTSEHNQLTVSVDPIGENELMILGKSLRYSAHSYEWIRDHTPLKHSDAEFAAMVARHPALLEAVHIVQHDKDGNRVIPGKPGVRLKRDKLVMPKPA